MLAKQGRAARDKKAANSLPKMEPLPGSVHIEFKKCGRPNCRCVSGKLHGPYFSRLWWEGGKLRKRYVRRSDVEAVHARCEAARQQKRQEREQRRQAERYGRKEWRLLLSILKEISKHVADEVT